MKTGIEKFQPFEKILGNTAELRLIEFLLPLGDISWNVLELSREIDVSVHTMTSIVTKLASWDMLKVTVEPEIDSREIRHTKYSINPHSPLVQTIGDFNQAIIDILLVRDGIAITKNDDGSIVIREHGEVWYPNDRWEDWEETNTYFNG